MRSLLEGRAGLEETEDEEEESGSSVCERDGGVWEGWRCVVGGVKECGGRGKVCGERGGGRCGMGGGVWEGVECGGRGKMCGGKGGGVW